MAEAPLPLCAVHQTQPAQGVCGRCGRFVCAGCTRRDGAALLCAECFARPEVRLAASPRARTALVLALLGLHGVWPCAVLAVVRAGQELRDIDGGAAPAGGRPWAQAARAIGWAASLGWAVVALGLLQRLWS